MSLIVQLHETGRKYLFLLLFLFFSGSIMCQTVSLQVEAMPFDKVLSLLEKQSSYRFIYSTESLSGTKPVTAWVTNKPFLAALDLVFRDQPLSFTIQEQFVTIQRKVATSAKMIEFVKGRVVNEEGEPVSGVTVTVKGTGNATSSRGDGQYILQEFPSDAILIFTSVGYERMEVAVKGKQVVDVKLIRAVTNLDEAVVIAYGTTTQRLNTGSVGRVTSKEIAQQPVTNPLLALHGRVPGVLITQSSGVPGASVKIQVRGQQSILAGNDPLFIIDGVPFAPGNGFVNQLISAAGNPTGGAASAGLSPFSFINPADIESIEILKDADATAIYGSRGANGVVLITTKKKAESTTTLNANYYSGFSRVATPIRMMNTQQYVTMRKEALSNDNLIPDANNAYDLLLWDTTRYTNLPKLLTGGTAHQDNVHVSLNGGYHNTHYTINGSYNRETTVYPGNLADVKGSALFSLSHQSINDKFKLNATASYSADHNKLNMLDITRFVMLAPNLPQLYDASGKLTWYEQGVLFANPLGFLERKYRMLGDYLNNSLQLSYRILPGVSVRANAGYNLVLTDEYSSIPRASMPENYPDLPSATFAKSTLKSWVVEPQIEYSKSVAGWSVQALAGGTVQQLTNESSYIAGSNYVNDAFLESPSAAGAITVTANNSAYRYKAIFGRLTLTRSNTYVLNLSGRRDGSSRFGPGKQYAHFGAIGAAWIFSNEKFVHNALPFLSFGKLRGSIGVTGNDQIGDYKFRNAWQVARLSYRDSAAIQPLRLYNPDFKWESNRKIEGTIELGFWQNRVYVSATYYNHRSNNPLINYTLPVQAGFSSVIQNSEAVVRVSGVELLVKVQLLQRGKFRWTTNFNATVPKNQLVAFPGLATSSYATRYVVGQSLNVVQAFQYLGVDAATGLYSYRDFDANGTLTRSDRVIDGNTDPKLYGGWGHTFSYGPLEADLFFDFRMQRGVNYLGSQLAEYVAGLPEVNQPTYLLDRWQKPGDQAASQRYTATTGSAAFAAAASYLQSSTAVYSDASFARLKNVSLAYRFSPKLLQRLKLSSARCYVQGQNLLTFTRYQGSDPERQNFYVLPVLRTIAVGLQIQFLNF